MRYMGGKYNIAPKIVPIILKDRKPGQWFVEPFVGLANVMWLVDGNRIGADANPYIIAFLKAIRDNPNKHPPRLTEEQYKEIKNNPEKFPKALVGWAGAPCSFSGKWFNSLIGAKWYPSVNRVVDYIQENWNQIDRQGPKLKGALFFHSSYDELDIPENSIIYCDPPYEGTNQTYHEMKTGDFDSQKFFKWCEKQVKNGHTVYVSEQNGPSHWEMVWQKDVKRTMGIAKNGFATTEKLFKVRLK